MSYLLDTNVVINFLDSSIPTKGMEFLKKIVDEDPKISVITKMETLGFNFSISEEQSIMENFIKGTNIIEINHLVVNKTIDIRKIKKIKLPDAIIAGSAIVNQLILITRNSSDFEDIDGLEVINPWQVQ